MWKLRILSFYAILIPLTVIFCFISLLTVFLKDKQRYWLITRWSHCFIFWLKTTCGIKYTVNGKENLPKDPCVVLANHQSAWETIFMQVLLPPQSWILKKELLKIPFFGWGLAMLKPIAIDRNDKFSVKKIISTGKSLLTNGRWILIFPEGTRVAPGKNKKFSRTAAALAVAAQVPILPVAHNAGTLWPKGFFPKKPGNITVNIGNSIGTFGKDPNTLTIQAEQWIKSNIY